MGQVCSGEQQADKHEVQDVVTHVKEAVEDAKEKVEEAAEQAKDAVQAALEPEPQPKSVVEQVAEAVEEAKEKAEELAEQAKEAVQDAVEAVAEAATDLKEKVEEKAAGVEEKAADVVVEAKEAVADTMTAAAAAITGTLIVEFDDGKGNKKSVDFKSKSLGFSPGLAGGGCCASAPKSKVVVSKVDKNRQAEKLGVKRGWEVKAINGSHFAGLAEAQKLLDDARASLPEVAA